MKKILLVALMVCMMFTMATGALAQSKLDKILEQGKITMATSPDFAPSEFVDPAKTGQESYVGCDIELGKYIAAKLGVELVIEAMDFSAVQGAVTQGKVDMAISGFAYTDKRAESMELSIFYNMDDESGQGLLVIKENADQYTKVEDFTGKKVAVQNASLQYNLLTTQLPDAIPEIVANLNDAVMMLITGKVDAVAVAGDNGEAYAKNYDQIMMCAFYFDYSSEGNVMAVTKGETELMEAINEILSEVNELGLYAQWKAEAVALAESLGIDTEE